MSEQLVVVEIALLDFTARNRHLFFQGVADGEYHPAFDLRFSIAW